MSYQVLARKYRPRRFQELVGQDVVARALTHALEQNRLHHAYLFTGTRGVGKTTIARILARCLNCETGITANPCGVCSTCRDIDEGRFVDLIEVDAASRTKVEDTRELLENVQYAPTSGRYKVYLIDEVHMLSGHSFNALLKTLEEPPPHVKFILATTDPQKLPITILSRCLQFALKPMTPERIVQHLQTVLPAENVGFDEAALWLLARAAQGSMRDALSLTDQAVAFGHGRLGETDVRSLLGSIDRDLVFRVLEAVQAKDVAALMQLVAGMAEQSIDFSGAVSEVISVLHRLAVAQAVPDAIDNAEGDRDRLLQLAQQLSPEDVQLFYQMALHGRRDLPLAVDARAGFEMTLLRMMLFRPLVTTDVINHAAGVNATEKKLVAPAPQVAAPQAPVLQAPVLQAPVAEPTPEPAIEPMLEPAAVELAPEPTPAPVPAAFVQSTSEWTPVSWAEWVDASGLTGGALNLARHALMQVGAQGQWQLCLSPKHQMLAAGQALTQLQTQFQAQYPQHRFDLVMQEPNGETPASRRQRLRAERLAQAESAVMADPVVKAVMTTFNAQIVPDSLVMND
ncbi:MAG: DNA polymerase III subunit gamma/tau [Moraxellaceae bacterium]|nr:DNA polymerase III subunit gamma/tau [Moraxellaceae bacterium]